MRTASIRCPFFVHTHPKLQSYALIHRALSNERRLMILRILWLEGPKTNKELARRLGIRGSSVSRHVHILLKAGLVEGKRKKNEVEFRLRKESWIWKYLDFMTN